jgi:hypothetical protein
VAKYVKFKKLNVYIEMVYMPDELKIQLKSKVKGEEGF